MLIALIFFLFFLAAFIAILMKKQGIRTAYKWMFLVLISLVLWLLILVIPRGSVSPLILSNWFGIRGNTINLRFVLKPDNWILAISIFTFNLALFLTGIARLDIRTDFPFWIFQLIFSAIAFLAVLSADLWTVILVWTALDVLDVFFNYLILKNSKPDFLKFAIKFIGSILLIWNIASLNKSGINPLLDGLVASKNTSLFWAALLHSGIFPLSTNSENYFPNEPAKIAAIFINVINFIVSFSLVINLPAPEIPILLLLFMSIFSSTIAFFAMSFWISNNKLEESIKFLLIGEAGIYMLHYYSGAAGFYFTYSLALIIFSVLWLVLFTHRAKNLIIFPLLIVFFASGLPFSLVAYGSRGFVGNGFSLGTYIMFIFQILFLIGYFKYIFRKNNNFNNLEIWYQTAYLAGLFLPLISIAAIILDSRSTLITEIQYWWVGIIVISFAILGFLLTIKGKYLEKTRKYFPENRFRWFLNIVTFEWVNTIFSFIGANAKIIVNGFSGILEGEGGILWAIVLFILILTALR